MCICLLSDYYFSILYTRWYNLLHEHTNYTNSDMKGLTSGDLFTKALTLNKVTLLEHINSSTVDNVTSKGKTLTQ